MAMIFEQQRGLERVAPSLALRENVGPGSGTIRIRPIQKHGYSNEIEVRKSHFGTVESRSGFAGIQHLS
jgi:hypothetical protein